MLAIGQYTYMPFKGATAPNGVNTDITATEQFSAGVYMIFGVSHIAETAIYHALNGGLMFNEQSNCGFSVFSTTTNWNIALSVTQYSGHDVKFDNNYKSGLHVIRLQ